MREIGMPSFDDEEKRTVESGRIGCIGLSSIVGFDLMTEARSSRRSELRKLSRVRICRCQAEHFRTYSRLIPARFGQDHSTSAANMHRPRHLLSGGTHPRRGNLTCP